MSISPASRSLYPAFTGPSMAAVLTTITTNPNSKPRRRQERGSAIRVLPKVLGRLLEEIPADPNWLQQRLGKVNPLTFGIKPRRWRNVLSLARAALKEAGIETAPGRNVAPLSDDWRDFFRYLNKPAWRIGLSRLAHYCSDRGISPSQVTEAVMAGFLAYLTDYALKEDPRKAHRVACVAWNQVAAALPLLAYQPVTVPNYLQTYSLPWDFFLASLGEDKDAYLKHLAGADLLEEIDFKPLRTSSIRKKDYELRLFVSGLVLGGRNPATLTTLADLTDVDVFKEGLRFHLAKRGNEPSSHIHSMACTLKVVAKYWVKVPSEHLDKLRSICRRLDPRQNGMTRKNRQRLQQFDDESSIAALVHLPERLLAIARRSKKPTRRDALRVQEALAIEFLLMDMLRISELAPLDLERHFTFSKKPGGPASISIPRGEVKNDHDINHKLAPSIVRLLKIYLDINRPLLVRQPSSALFPGEGPGHKSVTGFAVQIKKAIARETGLTVNVHLFRHFGSDSYLEANPGAYGVLKLVLGHKSVATTERAYCGRESAAALRQFDEQVRALRRRLPSPWASSPKKGGL